jgi:hypothetical protein
MTRLFISHSSKDDAFVRDLQQALDDLGQNAWIDSRELSGGDPLWPEIQQAIEGASATAIVPLPTPPICFTRCPPKSSFSSRR